MSMESDKWWITATVLSHLARIDQVLGVIGRHNRPSR